MIDVLLVEDDPVAGYVISELLSLSGYQLTVAASIKQAVTLIARKPRAVVLDLMLPGGSGEDIIGVILTNNPECRVVVWTGRPLTDEQKGAIRGKGAYKVLTKPTAFKDVLACLPAPIEH